MSKSVHAIVGTDGAVRALGLWGLEGVEYVSGYLILALDDTITSHIQSETPYPGMDSLSVEFAEQCAQASRVGSLSLFYIESFGGVSDTDAVAWSQGSLVFGPHHGALAPSKALEAIGITGVDAFKYRDILRC